MSYYVYTSSHSYSDYLQAASFEDSLTAAISKEGREIVTTLDRLGGKNAHLLRAIQGVQDEIAKGREGGHPGDPPMLGALERVSAQLAGGFERVEIRLDRISEGIDALQSTFHWGFSEVLASLGRLGDSMDELVRLSKTPSQKWAREQFSDARDSLRRGLHSDALENIERALGGYGDHLGYKLDHRFHHLKGIILMGSFKNHDPKIINPAAAEAAFLDASRYAAHDYPREAARAHLCAGWAAYAQGEVERALSHTLDALKMDKSSAEFFYQAAKYLMHLNLPDAATIQLQHACRLDPEYSLKCLADGDFQRHQARTNEVLEILRDESQRRATKERTSAQAMLTKAASASCAGYNLGSYASVSRAKEIFKAANAELGTHTYFGALEARRKYADVLDMARRAIDTFKQRALADARERLSIAKDELKAKQASDRGTANWVWSCSAGSILGIFLVSCLLWIVVAVVQEIRTWDATSSFETGGSLFSVVAVAGLLGMGAVIIMIQVRQQRRINEAEKGITRAEAKVRKLSEYNPFGS